MKFWIAIGLHFLWIHYRCLRMGVRFFDKWPPRNQQPI